MFSISANTVYALDNGEHSLEVEYVDSDGVNVGVYAHGDTFEDVLVDAINQIDEAIAEYGDDQADMEESANIEAQIAELQAKIDQLKVENEILKARHAEKVAPKNTIDPKNIDITKIINKLDNVDGGSDWDTLLRKWWS